jgi:hypothetical protein
LHFQAYSLTTLAEQIARLISGDQEGFMPENIAQESNDQGTQIQRAIESEMAKANPFEFGPNTEQQWQNRLAAAERLLDPYIEGIMPKLREKIQPNGGDEDGNEIELIVEELHRYRHFLARRQVKERLEAERKTLIGQS